MKPLQQLIRPNIAALTPYSSARDEYTGAEATFLDANENPFNAPYNRYPDPYQQKVKKRIAEIKGVGVAHLYLGNGSDEPIDLAFRAFCEPGVDNIVSIDPTYGMYQVAAEINNIGIKKVRLTSDFELDGQAVLNAVDEKTKLIFICSPNNPTGNALDSNEVEKIILGFDGIVVLDEAYVDFAPEKSLLSQLEKYPNLIILQTFSKAWGMAGIRLGMAFASADIIAIFNRIKYPYNINILTQNKALELLADVSKMEEWVKTLLSEREKMAQWLKEFDFVQKIYPSDANFLLVKTDQPREIYNALVEGKVIIRDRSKVTLCEGCLRFTVGSEEENQTLYNELKKIK